MVLCIDYTKIKQETAAAVNFTWRLTQWIPTVPLETLYTTAEQMVAVPDFIAFNVIMFAGVIAPLAVLDTLILMAFFIDRRSPFQIRFVLGNFMLLGLLTLLFLTLEHLTVIVLVTTDQPVPPPQFCSFITWALLSANSVRILLSATFSVMVFILIVKRVKALKKTVLSSCG